MNKSIEHIFDQTRYSGELKEIVSRRHVTSMLTQDASILFVGLNPSFLENAKKESYTYDVKQAVKDYPKHYKPFQDLATGYGNNETWTYLDVLQMRETDQKKVWEIINSDQGKKFICEQLTYTMELLETLEPKIIVVCNSLAGHFMGRDYVESKEGGVWMGYTFEFSESLGADVITGLHPESVHPTLKNTNLQGVPVLFGSTLTYQSAGIKKRLAWHIRFILSHLLITKKLPDHVRNQALVLIRQVNTILDRKDNELKNGTYERAAQLRDDQ